MHTFTTPEPINVDFDLYVGTVTVKAADRFDTVVTVAPTNPGNASDVEAADKVTVDMSEGTLRVKGEKYRDYVKFSKKKTRSVDVEIRLPSGSDLSGSIDMGSVTATGRLGSCAVKSGFGDLSVEHAASVRLKTTGEISVDTVDGDATLHTGMGRLRLGTAGGDVDVHSSNGPVELGRLGGRAKARLSMGGLTVDRVDNGLDAATSAGAIDIREVRGGTVELNASMGEVTVGVGEGVAAWVDATTGFGAVRNELTTTEQPETGTDTAKIRARNSFGDIVIRRS